ncbi:MAG TPA: hypothetical protein VKQ30_23240 [Ktedonobacterales bacterium]|nr:hypothetical protein [Ktedonobacterales bacterium]
MEMDDLPPEPEMTHSTTTRAASEHVSELAAQVQNLMRTTQTLIQRLEQIIKLAADERQAAADERKELMATARAMQQVVSESDQQIERLGDATLALAQAVEALEVVAQQQQH